MTNGLPLSGDLRKVVVFMHEDRKLDINEIVYFTGVPARTVYRILSIWRKTGEVNPPTAAKSGRPRALDFADTQVS